VTRDWYAPIVADAEAGFGGPLNAYEMMKVRPHLSHVLCPC
jgi:isocitrate lyase